MSKNRARDRAAKAEMNHSGAFRARAARIVDTTGQPSTVATVAFVLDAAIPQAPDPGLAKDATMEDLFAAYVARSALDLDFPARADVFVLPAKPSKPGDVPEGWRRIEALVMTTARRPWHRDEEGQRVITAAYRAAAAALNARWPGLPEEAQHAALSLDMLAALRWRFADEDLREILNDLQQSATHCGHTIGADSELAPVTG